MRSAMITIEVLISMIILFMVIATSVASIKQLKIVVLKQLNYERSYMAALSIYDYIDDIICKTPDTFHIEGELGEYRYRADCTEKKKLRNYIVDEDIGSGNKGNTLLLLYDVNLTIGLDNVQREYNYTKTVAKRLY